MKEVMGTEMAFLPMQGECVGGALCKGDMQKPSAEGSLLYLNGSEDLSTPLSRVEKASGKITVPKTKISNEI